MNSKSSSATPSNILSNSVTVSGTGAWGSWAVVYNNEKNVDKTISCNVLSNIAKKCGASVYGADNTNFENITTIKTGNIDVTANTKTPLSYSFNTGNYDYLVVRFWNNASSTALSETGITNFTEIQINKGSTALPYEPYFEGKRLEFNVCNKNLFDINAGIEKKVGGVQYSISGNVLDLESYSTGGAQYVVYAISGLDPTKNYKISCKGKKLVAGVNGKPWIKIAIRGSNDDGATYTGEIASKTIQELVVGQQYDLFPSQIITGYSFYGIYIYNNAGTPVSIGEKTQYYDIQFEESSTATTYIEHQQQMIPFPLAENQKLMEGDYLADDGVHHVRGQIVLDGTENWILQNASVGQFLKRNSIGGNVILSDKFKVKSSYTSSGKPYLRGNLYAEIGTEFLNEISVEAWKGWLQNNPVLVEYELAEETIEPYTPAQQEAYDKLKQTKSYNETTHIWQVTDGLPAKLDIVALKDF